MRHCDLNAKLRERSPLKANNLSCDQHQFSKPLEHLSTISTDIVCLKYRLKIRIHFVYFLALKFLRFISRFFFFLISVTCDVSTHRIESDRPGPLLSITVSERIMEKLLVWVEGPPSQGNELLLRIRDQQRVHLLGLFETLMTQSRQDVIGQISILRPLLQFLFKLSSQLRPAYSRVYGRTLYELCVLLCRDSFFLDRCRKVSDTSLLPMYPMPLVKNV